MKLMLEKGNGDNFFQTVRNHLSQTTGAQTAMGETTRHLS
jgi:hypothetical protein